MKYLEERGFGFDVRVAKVPIVPAAILFDLGIGRADVRPDAAMGYQACLNASSTNLKTGNVGAGMGATIGKISGMPFAVKSGIGAECIHIGGGVLVGALVAVNAFGDVIDPRTGEIIGGARVVAQVRPDLNLPIFSNTLEEMRKRVIYNPFTTKHNEHTVIGVVITNAQLTKEQANFVAQMAHDGLARTIRPAHTLYDGDTLFTLATGNQPVDVNLVGSFAAEAVAEAVLDAVWSAEPAGGLPSASSILSSLK
jgi:L-aminopeptidase/D-esterase-like protein